jgi:hypothetical protein
MAAGTDPIVPTKYRHNEAGWGGDSGKRASVEIIVLLTQRNL